MAAGSVLRLNSWLLPTDLILGFACLGASKVFRRISSVKNFGVFNDYSGGQIPEFASFNLLYGWNYSGKTTLSRLFRCLEKGELHPDYINAKFSLSHQDGNLYEQDFAIPCNVRVFNEDFRNENLRWDDANGFTPILILGSENIEKRDALTRKEGERDKLGVEITDREKDAAKLEKAISEAETECAGQIARELGIWSAPGSEDTELGVLMEPEVDHGEAEVHTRVQA